MLGAGATADVLGIGTAIFGAAGGALLLLALLAGESDNAFADLYSAAVSIQNVAPKAPQRWLVGALGALALGLALALSMERYELFLLLVGSVFVPLFGVFAADWLVRARGRYGSARLFATTGVRWVALLPWVAGFLVYHWSVPTGPEAWVTGVRTVFADWLGLPFPLFDSALGASLPSFALAFILAVLQPRRGAPLRGGGLLRDGARGRWRRGDQEDHRGLDRRVADRELGPGGDEDRPPLIQAPAALADLDRDLAGEQHAQAVRVRVRDRPDLLGALETHDLGPQVRGLEHRAVLWTASANRTRSRRSFDSMATAYRRGERPGPR